MRAILVLCSAILVVNSLVMSINSISEAKRSHIEGLVQSRIKCRADRDYLAADRILQELTDKGVLVHDISYKQGGGCTWEMQVKMEDDGDERSIMEIVRDIRADSDLSRLKRKLRNNEDTTFSRDRQLSGRAYADAAFSLALGGVEDVEVFDLLVQGASTELNRCAHRASFRPIDILMIAEKFAVAGVRDQTFYALAASKLREKGQDVLDAYPGAVERLEGGTYSLLEDRPLFWLFRHSARDRKAGRQMDDDETENQGQGEDQEEEEKPATKRIVATPGTYTEQAGLDYFREQVERVFGEPMTVQPETLFVDPSLPLVIDLGCGYGVSMLGLCHQQQQQEDGPKMNYLGVDMKTSAISYASSISARWGIRYHCAFMEADVLSALRWARDYYLGPVQWVMCQFPSPFTLQGGGNGQLPDLSTFMINEEVLQVAEDLLSSRGAEGHLLLQSQVEDVMVAMKGLVDINTSLSMALDPIGFPVGIQAHEDRWVSEEALEGRSRAQLAREDSRLRRSLAGYEKEGMTAPRAFGEGYLASNPLGQLGRTETEVMCEIEDKPVHRAVWRAP